MYLRVLLAALLVVTAGCGSTADLSRTDAETTVENGTATSTPPASPGALSNLPEPSGNCSVRSLPNGTYPSLPSELTRSNASRFALKFEEAYAWAALEAEGDVTVSGYDGRQSDVVDRTDSGYVVETFVSMDFVVDRDEARLAGSQPFRGWYYVTDRFATRAVGDGGDSIPATGWETVACS